MINEKIQSALNGKKYSTIRCEFYMDNKLVEELEIKTWEAIDKATKFINENDNVVMFFFKMSKMDLVG